MMKLSGLTLFLTLGLVGITLSMGHNVEKRDAIAEQERIMAYQMRIQNFINARETGTEMKQSTERLQCYSCQNAKTNEECNARGMVTCLPTQTSCQTEIRVFNPRNRVNARIKKGCKQDRACTNNFLQNDRQAWPSTQCNAIPRTLLSVCRYCCTEPGCNKELPDHVCGPLEVPENGSMTCRQDGGMKTSTCSFSCERCHRLKGSRVRMCLENAMWSGVATECVYDEKLPGCKIETTCPSGALIAPSNGDVECTDSNNWGSQCRYTCDRGYILNGKRVLRCDDVTENWDDEKPICVRGDDSSNPCHQYAVFEFATDGKLDCTCRTGFTGDGFISCEDVDECEEGMDFCDENANCSNTVGSYDCTCKSGFEGNGFECGDINECLTELNDCDPVAGVCLNEDGGFRCTCEPEYTGDGRNCTKLELACPGGVVGDICLRDEPMPPSDHPNIEIEAPTEPENIIPDDVTEVYTETRREIESCVRLIEHDSLMRDAHMYEDINNRLLQKLVSTANFSAMMGPYVGLDDRIEKGVLRWRDGKKLDKEDFQVWAPGQPKMIDEEGFGNCVNLVSDPVGTHTMNFLWKITLCSSPTRYVCNTEKSDHPVTTLCMPIVEIANGNVECSDGWRTGSVCSYACDEGYVLRGEKSSVTCLENTLMWDEEPPVCVRAVCPRPLSTPNSGFMECSNGNREGSVCSFGCLRGHKLQGNETVICQRDLSWSSQRPCCRDDCPPYARMNLILVLDSSRSIGGANFRKIKKFARVLVRKFEVSEDFTQVSAITYSNQINVLRNQSIFTSGDEIDEALDELAYKGSGTLIGKALNFVTANLVRQREGSHDIVVLLTDGISHDDVYLPSERLKNTGAHVVAVGVKHAWRYQLGLIASQPIDANVVEVETYDDLELIVKSISEKVCQFQC